VARATTLREGHAAVGIAIPTVVVAALVTPQGLAGRERLVADGALVGPAACGAGRSRWVVAVLSGGVLGGGLAVAGLVATECLVGREGFVADRALVRELQGRWLCRRLRCGFRAAAGKHDETQGKVLFLGGWVLDAGSFGALPLSPRLGVLAVDFVFIVERGGGGGRIQSFQGHLLLLQWGFLGEQERRFLSFCIKEGRKKERNSVCELCGRRDGCCVYIRVRVGIGVWWGSEVGQL
jgi:hypothetical protein